MLNRNIILHGSPYQLPEQIPLRAGPVHILYENGRLRRVRCNMEEILVGVYVAVRDPNWNTVTGQITVDRRDVTADSFYIEFTSEHRNGDIHFIWYGSITGEADGTVIFKMNGEARTTFRCNRIGFCVLYPMTLAGRACTLEHTDGTTEHSFFPAAISPRQLFCNLRAIHHEIAPGLQAIVRMEGDTFEAEDQRNWADASYKIYCTPLSQPFPTTVQSGTKIYQSVTLRFSGTLPILIESSAPLRTIHLLSDTRPFPMLGLYMPERSGQLSSHEIKRLKALRLSHLRADLDFRKQATVEAQLKFALDYSSAIGTPLELALHLTQAAQYELEDLARALLKLHPHLARFLIFHVDEKSTTSKWLDLAHDALKGFNMPLGAGTNAYFTELNRCHPPENADLVVYSINPQVHAMDNMTLVENLAALGATVRSARAFIGARTLLVGPVTLRKRWNPDATGLEPDPAPGELPIQVDPRQMSLFGAGWTAISLKYLAEAGADLLTYYETVGWRGVMESEAESPLPEKFPSLPGGIFPLYHVFADVAEFTGGDVSICHASQPLDVDALALRKGTHRCVLSANFTADAQQVLFPEIRRSVRVRILDTANAEQAMMDPEGWRTAAILPVPAGADGLTVVIPPFGLAKLDWNSKEDG
jgi:hypothetical protein